MKNTVYISIVLILWGTFILNAQDSLRNEGYIPYPKHSFVGYNKNITTLVSKFDTLNRKSIISFSPQHLIKRGIRIEFERKLTENKWLVIAPSLYFAQKENKQDYDDYYYDDTYNLLLGAGIAPYLKSFVRQNGDFGGYISWGLNYNYFYLQYYEAGDIDEEIDAEIHRIGFDITLGYQVLIADLLVLDMYTGMGARKSYFHNGGGVSNDKFNNSHYDYNVTSNIFLIGVKIGLLY